MPQRQPPKALIVESSSTVTAPQVRRLLRALGDPAALRRDPLARRLVGNGRDDPVAQQERTQQLIALLRASLSAMCTHAPTPKAAVRLRRAARIVERCDLDGAAAYLAGAAELARRRADDAAAKPRRRVRFRPRRSSGAWPFWSQIAMGARRLDDAARLLDEIGDRADSPRLRPRAMLAKSEALLQAGEFERASASAPGRTPQARRTLARALAALRRNGSAHALHRAQALARHLQTA